VQWQIVAKDPDALTRFYASLFGWKVKTNNALGYREVETQSPRGINGGVWPSPPEGHNLVQLFVEVDDVDAYIAKATKLGATVIVPSELPTVMRSRSSSIRPDFVGLYRARSRIRRGDAMTRRKTAVTATAPLHPVTTPSGWYGRA
jgi:predicted enzyme related to lactoylglutathione lyase